MGFLLGLIVGMILCPLLLALVSKPLMMWFAKREANKLIANVKGRLSGLQNQFQSLNENGEENSKTEE